MKLIFDWCDGFCEAKRNWNDNEQIISLEIHQKECGFAFAKIVIVAKDISKLISQRYVRIGVQFNDDQILTLFTGRVISFPAGFESSTVTMELISEPSDYQKQLDEFCAKNLELYKRQNKHEANNYQFDDLFFSRDDLSNPTVFLEGKNDVFYWDMQNGRMLLSNIHQGNKQLQVESCDILQNSLKIRLAREPYKCINIKITASWIQYESGIIDLIPMIASCFSSGKINSFTDISSSLKNLCKFHENSGYSVLYNNIKEITPFGQHPRISPSFTLNNKAMNLKRFYFAGQLICGWHYKQKRTENVHTKIVNSHSKYGREKNVHFKLSSLQLPKKYPTWFGYTYYAISDTVIYDGKIFKCKESHMSSQQFDKSKWNFVSDIPDAVKQESCRSFFSETRGQNAIKYAIKRAIALINYSSRYIEIDFCVHAAKFLMDANVNNSVKIQDSRFPNGYIEGKIIKTKFIADADQKLLKITIACRDSCISEQSFSNLQTTVKIDIDDTDSINPADIVTGIEIKHPPEEQIEVLQGASFSSVQQLRDTLKEHATKIKITLHPQNTVRELTKDIYLPDFII